MVIAGSGAAQLLPKCRGHPTWKSIRAVCIGIVIASGTFVSTYGWNQRAGHLRDRALLIGAAGEWRLNKAYMHVMEQRRDDFLKRGGNLHTPVFVFPKVQETRYILTQAITFQHDKDLLHALTVYVMAADRLVPALEHIDSLCSQPVATMDMKRRAVESELGHGRDSAFEFFMLAHKQFGDALASRYRWSLDEATSRVDNDYLEALENMQLNLNPDMNQPK